MAESTNQFPELHLPIYSTDGERPTDLVWKDVRDAIAERSERGAAGVASAP
ncbi:hypothetical protein ACFQDG_13030 [Natronoarchaeum mannanilyticum]|uniref:Uncharacterized protein n=1 Tax=Natronoarchaeum mannanilyticum TaxID=926360 RepID=A0AAV3T9I7_9EURY